MYVVKRYPHIMRTKEKTVVPCNLLFFDCETRIKGTKNDQGIGKHVLWFGWAYAYRMENGKRTREVWCRFTTGRQFFDFVKTRILDGKPLFVYAHNAGFDLTIVGFFELFKSIGIVPDFYTLDSPPTIFRCKWDKKTVNFVDTLNYWTQSLAKLGHSIGREKQHIPKECRDMKIWDAYCRNDVQIIADAIDKLCRFVIDHRCGSLGFTLASLSMNAFRHRHMKHEIFIHDRIKVCELERDAYYGGYVNCFYVGTLNSQRYYNVDINSHYPSVMRNTLPIKLVEELDNVPLAKLESRMTRYLCIARVMLNSKSELFPKRMDDKLIYARGRFITSLCTPELERALNHNAIMKVEKLAIYEHAPVLKDFVNYFWALRRTFLKSGNEVDAFFCKILLNSLYGKFGQRGVAWVDLTPEVFRYIRQIHNVPDTLEEMDPSKYPVETVGYQAWTPEGFNDELYLRNVLNGLQIKVPIGEHYESFPAIAAFVTAYGREYLLQLVKLAGERHVYYCDTDSLFVDSRGLGNLKRAKLLGKDELGKLKIADEATSLTIRGLKDYQFGDVEKIKGVRHDAIKVKSNLYLQTQFEGLKGIMKRGGEPFVQVKTITKELSRIYDKGKVLSNGLVLPFTLADW